MTRKNREFTLSIRRQLAERVAYMCCNPLCRRLTIKRSADSYEAVRSGKACHIHSAGKNGPRAKADMTDNECKAFENGIWACDTCAREIDDNESKYSAEELRRWKDEAEEYVEGLVTQDTRLRQLRVMMQSSLSCLRLVTAVLGPGSACDQTFENAGRIPVARLLIEAEQALFENGFAVEADSLLRIKEEMDLVLSAMSRNCPGQYLDISSWKNEIIRRLMVDILRFSDASYGRYLDREMAMVRDRRLTLAKDNANVVVPFQLPQ